MKKTKMKLTNKILLGLFLGILTGLLLGDHPEIAETFIKPFGTLFINAIKMIIVPLIFSSLVVGASSMNDAKEIGRIGSKVLIYFLITTFFAVTIGITLAILIKPGLGLTIPVGTTVSTREVPSMIDTLVGIIPSNPLGDMVQGHILQLIVFALVCGISATLLPDGRGKPFLQLASTIQEMFTKVTGVVMSFAPIGVFGLITPVVAVNGIDVLLVLLKVILAVYIGCILHALITYSSLLKIFTKLTLREFFKGMFPATLTAFTTCSSLATLPVTIKCTKENLKIPDKISTFVLTLGSSMNTDGTALYIGVTAIFSAQVCGIDLSTTQLGLIALSATLGSIGAGSVPGGSFIMLMLALQSVGLPLEATALIAGIDRILDMPRTAVNILGDSSAATVISGSEEKRKRLSEAI
ncbi:MAG: dicarboxylate/amino acid:cation symporter [Marinisporobacter sp.]|jgi:Na+/H+-dicarboxylate symporter|nr:dicarboxylate/amino acid:cation symporter [Marinisporobacter sp.]